MLSSAETTRTRGMIARVSAEMIHSGEFSRLLGWLDTLREPVMCHDLLLSTRYAWALALSGRRGEVETRLADAERALPEAVEVGRPAATTPKSHSEMIRSVVARTGGRQRRRG